MSTKQESPYKSTFKPGEKLILMENPETLSNVEHSIRINGSLSMGSMWKLPKIIEE